MTIISPVRVSPVVDPGLRLYQPGIEHYPVKGCGAIVVALEAGDKLTIVDPEGRQPCEVVAYEIDGRPGLGGLGISGGSPAAGLQAILAGHEESARRVLTGLRRRNLDLARAEACVLFGDDSQPGSKAEFEAQRALICIIAAPGEDMPVDAQNPPTDLRVTIVRARPPGPDFEVLPDPLADPRFECRIDRRTASAYEVKAGEFIQIIEHLSGQLDPPIE